MLKVDENAQDIELFTVILNKEGKIVLKASDYIKSSISVKEVEKLLEKDVKEHLDPIVVKLINAAF